MAAESAEKDGARQLETCRMCAVAWQPRREEATLLVLLQV